MLIFFLMSVTFVYSADLTCCFDGDIFRVSSLGCGEGEFDVGQTLQVGNNLCDFSSMRQVCEYNLDNQIYCNFLGYEIYDFDWYPTFIQDETGLNVDDYCNLIPYVDTCVGDLNPSGAIGSDPDNTNNPTGSTIGDPLDIAIPTDTELLEILDVELRKFCSDTGGPFGFFSNEQSCNGLVDQNGEFPCLYNPYLAGEVSISAVEATPGLGYMEEGCVPKTSINRCYDYKTEINCNENIIFGSDFSTNDLALQNCVWVPTNDFLDSNTYFEVDSGICISDAIDEMKNYDLSKFVDRNNLLINPSFEINGDTSWSVLSRIDGREDSFNGYSYARVDPGVTLGQGIENLGERISYETLLYIMTNEDFAQGDELRVLITEIDSDGSLLPSEFIVDLSSFNGSNGIFKKYVIFPNHVVNEGTVGINFEISSDVLVYIDAVYFGVDDVKFTTGNNGLFEPLEIIPSEASSCGVCFDEKNFNFCTQEKSDLLGDCSYMVDSLSQIYESDLEDDNYLGSEIDGGNPYLNNFSSQSLANSLVFCELYVTQDTCEDPNSFLNYVVDYYHFESGANLCKWNDIYGCFKDSDNSNGPDTILNGEIYHRVPGITYDNYGVDFFPFYNRSRYASLPSDFEFACDYLSPEFYVSFEAQDEDLNKIYVTDSFPENVLGNVIFDVFSYDLSLESCSPFDVSKKIYIDYEVVNSVSNSSFRFVQGSVFNQRDLIQNFFVDIHGNTILEEGVNSFRIYARDQSGNVGKIRNFDFDVDLYGPQVVLNDISNGGVYGPYSSDSQLSFTIFDTKSGVVNCSYDLDANGDIPLDFYNSSGDFLDFASPNDYSGSSFMFDLPIYNSSLSGDYYALTISCEDVFRQTASETYIVSVDYDTSFVLISPQDLYGLDEPYLVSSGFINSGDNFWAVSADTGISSCSFDFTGTDGSGSLNSEVIIGPFDMFSYNFDSYINISGSFDFASDGIKDFTAFCLDVNGNRYEENLRYYYDTAFPVLDDFNLIDVSSSNNSVALVGSDYYTRRTDRSELTLHNVLNLSVDGTLSWMSENSEDYNISSWNGSTFKTISNADYFPYLKNDSKIGQIYIDDYVDLYNYNLETSEDNLYERRYNVEFADKAGNIGSSQLSYYFDDSMPDFVFSGDIFKNGDLYTGETDPLFGVSFNTPDYRTWNCDVEVLHEGLTYIGNYDGVNSMSFRISDVIGASFEFNADSSLDIGFSCVDIYGVELNNVYTLKFDNTPPILDRIYLDNGNNIYLANAGNNVVYNAVIDKLVFDFEDTGEEGYECFYGFEELDSHSICSDDVYEYSDSVGSESLTFKTGDLDILDETQESMCYRDRIALTPVLESFRDREKTLYSKINVQAECFDRVNLSTGVYSFEVNVNYVAGNRFVDFDVEYNLDSAKFVARSMTPFDSVVVSFDDNGQDVLTYMVATGEEDGLFIYSTDGDISGIDEGFSPLNIFAVGFGSDGSIWDRITTDLVIDRTPPVIDFSFPDANSNGEVFFKDFQIIFDVYDEGGSSLFEVELFLDGDLIYSGNNISEYDSSNLYEPDFTKNHYSIDRSNYFGSVIFANGTINGVYEFEVVAKDGFGNEVNVTKTILVKDGVGIRLIDSDSALVDFDRFSWITKFNAPVLNFETSKSVISCNIKPLYDDVWIKFYSEDEQRLSMTQSGIEISDFSYDLSTFNEGSYDLSQGDQKDFDILIQCNNGTQVFNFTRTLSLINTLPDYVLSSSEGFLINNEPYETNLEVLSVGPYKYITCAYSVDGSPFIDFNGGISYRFVESLSFANFAQGTYNIDLKCADKLGTEGPLKSYNFIVNQDVATTFEDIKLTNGALDYELVDNTFYVDTLDGFGLEFKANKNDLACSYYVEKYIGNPITSLFTYFINLFVDNTEDLSSSSNPFVYLVSSGISFSEGGNNQLIITCGADNFEYNVLYVEESSFDFDLVKVN